MSIYHNIPPYDDDVEATEEELKDVARTGATLFFVIIAMVMIIGLGIIALIDWVI